MDRNTKSLIKHTIMGLLGGGAISAAYAMAANKEKKPEDEFGEDEIVVPLSRRLFMQAVRGKSHGKKQDTGLDVAVPSEDKLSEMTPGDLAALKNSLLKKRAEKITVNMDEVHDVESPECSERPVGRVLGANSTFARDSLGRFVSQDDDISKEAGVGEDAVGVMSDAVGAVGGMTAGLVAIKMLSDRIMINRKKKQVEESRRKYTDMLAREVNDYDAPYYTKRAEDRGIAGSTIGLLGLSGLATGTIAGTIMYRIMENRRLEAEKAKDKDMAKYPSEKIIKFQFPKVAAEDGFFG